MAWNLGAFDGNETRSNGIALQSVFSHTMLPESLRGLPTTPIWPGFAINTLLYAATLYLLFTTPAKLRRHRRIKRNLCPACAYPVRDSTVCTECGKALLKWR